MEVLATGFSDVQNRTEDYMSRKDAEFQTASMEVSENTREKLRKEIEARQNLERIRQGLLSKNENLLVKKRIGNRR